MQITHQEILDLIAQNPLFAHLEPALLNQLAEVMVAKVFRKGEIVFEIDDPADAMFILCEGKVELQRPNNKHEAGFAVLTRGDIFGEEALLFDDPRYYQVVALIDCILLRLDVADFLTLWEELPAVEAKLEILIKSRSLSSEHPLPWLQADEHVHVMTRRHPAILWGKLILPVILALTVIVASLIAQFFWLPGRPYGWLFLGFGLPASILWLIWRIIDWRNDYFIVTNKRVVWIEKVALIYQSRQEAPLRTIMSVGIQRSRLGTAVGFADVVVTTYVGTIRLSDLASAETIASLIESYWHRAKSFNLREESELMTEKLEEKLDLREDHRATAMPGQSSDMGAQSSDMGAPSPEEGAQSQQNYKEPGFLAWLFSDFIRLRYESDGAIVYRKHWFILVEKAWLPAIMMTLGLVALAARLGGRLSFIPLMPGVIGILLFMFVVFVWIIYLYADWRNDVFKITLEQIIDLDRKPLGKVRRRSAPLENVLSIEYQRLGFWGFLFNFGTVFIAVGNQRLTFDHVYNPSEVQQDIFYRMGERLDHLRQYEIDSERERVSEWIASYHRKTRQNGGSDRISSGE